MRKCDIEHCIGKCKTCKIEKKITLTDLFKTISEYHKNISKVTADFEEFISSFEIIEENLSVFIKENKNFSPEAAEKSFHSQASLISDFINIAQKRNNTLKERHEIQVIEKQVVLDRIKKKFNQS